MPLSSDVFQEILAALHQRCRSHGAVAFPLRRVEGGYVFDGRFSHTLGGDHSKMPQQLFYTIAIIEERADTDPWWPEPEGYTSSFSALDLETGKYFNLPDDQMKELREGLLVNDRCLFQKLRRLH